VRPREAFTLIELLVVVGIIALLLAMMLPSLFAARREAQRVVCQSNLKQVAFAWRGYLDESRGWFPPRVAFADINYGGLQGVLPVYQGRKLVNKHLKLPLVATKGGEVFCCPSDNGGGVDPNTGEISPSFFRHYGTSYFTNPLLAGSVPFPLAMGDPCAKMSTALDNVLPYVTANQFDHESRLLLVADAGWYKVWTYSNREPVVDWHRAKRKYNVGFMDGHADFVEIRKGIYTTAKYTVMPNSELQNASLQCQGEPKE
jgi:prepilin-type N-terminal cleavage/methylation domain-containing protein/prepilin-type processing-associated H-X9-DG protein